MRGFALTIGEAHVHAITETSCVARFQLSAELSMTLGRHIVWLEDLVRVLSKVVVHCQRIFPAEVVSVLLPVVGHCERTSPLRGDLGIVVYHVVKHAFEVVAESSIFGLLAH